MKLRLKELREGKWWSQRELARNAKVTESTIVRLEKPGDHNVRFSTVRKLATALGVPPGELVMTAIQSREPRETPEERAVRLEQERKEAAQETPEQAVSGLRGIWQSKPGSGVDDFLADRREEAGREAEEFGL